MQIDDYYSLVPNVTSNSRSYQQTCLKEKHQNLGLGRVFSFLHSF